MWFRLDLMDSLSGLWGTLILVIGLLVVIWTLADGLREWCHREWQFLKSASRMKGPVALPIIGNALFFAGDSDELVNRVMEYSQPYDKPFRVWMGPKLFVVIKNPRDFEVVLNSSVASHKPYEYRFLASYLGHGLVTDSGATHRAQRKVIMPMVSGKELNKYIECFDRQSRRCVECLEGKVGKGEFDIIHYMDDCTLDMILETVMGTPGTAQSDGYKGLIECCSRAIALAHDRTLKIWLYPDWIYACTTPGRQFASSISVLRKFAENLVNQKKDEYYASKETPEGSFDRQPTAVLDRLIAHNEETEPMDDIRLRDAISNIWMPAQDPTALSCSFLFVMLGMHPDIQDKVRKEVNEVIGDEDVTMEKLSKLRYLEMVIKETIRLFPVGPMTLRELTADLEFETCTAPKGCTLALMVFETHRDPKYWIEPEKFNPDRFTPENSIDRHPYAYVPFSSGIRSCIGRHYAMVLIKTLVTRVVQKYRIGCSGSLETLRLKFGVSVRAVDGYRVSITRL